MRLSTLAAFAMRGHHLLVAGFLRSGPLFERGNFSRTGRWGNVLVRNSCKRKAHDSEPAVSPSSAREGFSKRDIREQENAQFPGGLQNPNRAVARNPGLRRVGSRIRSVLEQFLCDFPDVSSVLDLLGKEDAPGFEPEHIKELRSRFASEFSVALQEEYTNLRSYWVELWESFVSLSRDLDVAVLAWLRTGFPLGIEREIQYCSVFPPVDANSASVEASKPFGKLLSENPVPLEDHRNYESFYSERALAETDLARVVDAGYATRHESS